MTLPTNDEFANRDLSIEELETIAAGWPHWVHAIAHFVSKEASAAENALFGWIPKPKIPTPIYF